MTVFDALVVVVAFVVTEVIVYTLMDFFFGKRQ